VKNLSAILGLWLIALTMQAALPQPDLIAQIHFAGAQKISADAQANAFTNEFCSVEALALRAQTATKLAGWLAGWLQTNLTTTVADGPAKLRPLFDDLQTSEWFLEARATAGGRPEVAVAIKLEPARAQLWQANLKPFFPAAAFKSAGGWLIFDSDPALLKLGDRLAQQVSAPPAGWFDLDVNWPRLAQWYPELKELALPETQCTITAPDTDFRINGKFSFAQNLALNLEPWRVPTNTVQFPFNSFTAVRGFASWLQSQKWAQPYQILPPPNELFTWSLPWHPLETYAAVPVPDAKSALAQIYAKLAPAIAAANTRSDFMLPVGPEWTNGEVVFTGVPYLGLKLRALSEPAGQFLHLEMFPKAGHRTPLPPELFQRLATKNLVFYHWEMSSNRIPQLLHLSQLGLAITKHKQLAAESAAFKWLQKIGPGFGSTDTEITQTGPAEFTFARKTPGIFTGAELYTLANWLEATNFPGCDLKLPPRVLRKKPAYPQPFQLTPIPPTGH
jgi:hypothetical protein